MLDVSENKPIALIIGGGPAGLTAAYELLKQSSDYKVIVLEASDHLGGISATMEYKGNRMDLGGHRFFTKSEKVNQIWSEVLQKQTAPAEDELDMGTCFSEYSGAEDGDPVKNDNVMLVRRRVSRIYYNNKFFDYPVKLNLKLFKTMGLGTSFLCGMSYLKSCIHKRPETSLENFYINRFGKKLYSMFFESYTEKLWGIHPSKLDASWGAQRVKGLSILSILKNALFKSKNTETSLIEKFYYPKFGPGQMWQEMAKMITDLGGEIIYDARVISLVQDNNTWTVKYTHNNSEIDIRASVVFSSMPIRELIAAMPAADPEVAEVAASLNYRDFRTAGILCSDLVLKNKTKLATRNNIIPDCWIYIQDKSVTVGRLQIFNNWSPYLVKDKNTCWIGMEYFCTEVDELWSMPDNDFLALAKAELEKLGIVEAGNILDSVSYKVRKAYPVYDKAYQSFPTVSNWLIQQPNLYCIGRNGQHRYNNLDHSMLTACVAVTCLLNNFSRSAVWDVNTEQEYHEEKK